MWDSISSKPAIGVSDVNGAFDSHTLPPIIFKDLFDASVQDHESKPLPRLKHLNLLRNYAWSGDLRTWAEADAHLGPVHIQVDL